ncbi:hypothetical protein NSS79_16580 [Paenibacillus sp. FSL L8-0436]
MMDEFLKNTGLIAIMIVVLYTIKKIYDYIDLKRAGDYEDDEF